MRRRQKKKRVRLAPFRAAVKLQADHMRTYTAPTIDLITADEYEARMEVCCGCSFLVGNNCAALG